MRIRLALPVACALTLVVSAAAARVRLCVRVDAGRVDASELRRLVKSEVNRHTTHQAVDSGCDSQLTVELVELGSDLGGGRYLTGRIDTEVPHRESIAEGDTARAVERLLAVVLHNDPRRLYGPERDDWIGRTRAAFLLRGTTYFGLELYQTTALVGGEIQALPGAALSARREVDRVHVGVRLGAASAFDESVPALRLSQQLLAQLELALYSSSEADATLFGAALAGLEYQRYEAHADQVQSATFMGLSLGLRGGVELLRSSHVRFQFFTQLLAPTFVARDETRAIVDQWTPTLALGAGAML